MGSVAIAFFPDAPFGRIQLLLRRPIGLLQVGQFDTYSTLTHSNVSSFSAGTCVQSFR